MKNYEKMILDCLVDKYENSKSFIGANKVNQNFSVKIADLFPLYDDEAEFELYLAINSAIKELTSKNYISAKILKNGVVKSVRLNTAQLENIYIFLKRTPKSDVNSQLSALLESYCSKNEILCSYCTEQLERLSHNKSINKFDGDMESYENILKVLSQITTIEHETYRRDFSVRVLGDSKAFEKISSKVVKILFKYGDFPNEDTVLEELNIIKNPGHIYFKGCGIISLNGQEIDLKKISGDIAISTAALKDITKIRVTGDRLITIENLTTYNFFNENNCMAIYLGGYHNSAKRDFIKKLYSQNTDITYYHYGDIDAGGFQILLHLRKKTGINFIPYKMDLNTLTNNIQFSKPLTPNDRKRLTALLDTEFESTIAYMLENNCKLEQEALDL